ncbi:MAG: hypothetical protein HYY11_10015 [Candidatus Methylomirabilis oxyfera]|nr:hypothetical protein [Candidatus Methylomirabilis oxyfera]
MMPLSFTVPAKREHFPPDADVWDINLIFRLEKKCIDDHLVEQAGAAWGERGLDGAINGWDALENAIKGSYLKSRVALNTNIYNAANSGQLKNEAPTNGQIRKITALFVLSVIAEISVMLVQLLFDPDNFNIFAIAYALMLAVGGVAQGWGVGHLQGKSWRAKTNRPLEGEQSLSYWMAVGIGTLLILFIAAARSSGAFEPFTMFLTFGVTLIFGEVVAFFEALREKYKYVRDALLNDMLHAQQMEAPDAHSKELKRGGYYTTYKAAVDKAEQTGRRISKPEKPQTPSPAGYPSPSDTN